MAHDETPRAIERCALVGLAVGDTVVTTLEFMPPGSSADAVRTINSSCSRPTSEVRGGRVTVSGLSIESGRGTSGVREVNVC